MNVRQGAVSVKDKYGRDVVVPARLTHIHSCGHYDGCYLFASVALDEPCVKCKREAFRLNNAESQGRCPICGGSNPGDMSHVRCM